MCFNNLMGKSKIRITQMLKRLLSVLACTTIASLSGALLAQLPEQARMSNSTAVRRLSPQACADQNAGSTVRSLGAGAKSNDKHFLCAGDSLVIVHQQNQNLSNDPDLTTPAGIGYAFYNCEPTISGLRYQDIRDGDACLNRQTILLNGVPTAPVGGFWSSYGQINGNHTFVNTGAIQRLYNNNAPKKLYFAPITIDDFAGRQWTGNSCTNANIRDIPTPLDSFSVVYLNKINATNITYNYGTLTGQFAVSGGLSEYNNSNYTITIQRTSSNAIIGSVTSGAARHNGTVSVTVPQAGSYTVTITDGKSCEKVFSMHFPVIELSISNDTVPRQGDTSCVKITARGFNNIITLESNFTFNQTLLQFTRAQNFNLTGMDGNSFSNTAPGIITVSWGPNAAGITRPDNTVLFELCFVTLGSTGTLTPVRFSDTLNPIEVYYNNPDPLNRRMGVVLKNGGVFIGNRVFSIAAQADSVPCSGGFNGRVLVTPVGGSAPYTYNWTGPNGSNGNGNIQRSGDQLIIGGLAAGAYNVSVTDAFGGRKVTNVAVGEPAAALYAVMVTTNIRCFGDTTGVLRLSTYGGGTAPYRFSWSNSVDSVGTAVSRLRAGAYTATLTDARGCTYSLPGTIGVPQLRIVTKSADDAVCLGVNNGVARISAMAGGTIPNGRYVFQWSNGVQHTGVTDELINLAPGRYFVTVSDNNNCPVRDTFNISFSRQLALNVVKGNVTCAGQNNGVINVLASANGGSERTPYTFVWSANAGTPITTSPTSVVNRLGGGTYTLTTRDADGCRIDSSFIITTPDSIKIDTQGVRNESCLVGGDGFAQVRVTGGRPNLGNYRYVWSRSANDTLRNLSGLIAGSYTVTVTDSVGCSASKTITILVPQKPIISRIDTVRPKCYNTPNGRLIAIAVPAAGGGAIRSYRWSTGAVGDTLSNVGGGVYTVTVTDANGCTKVDSQRLIPPARVEIDTARDVVENPDCPGRMNGRIIIPGKGGVGSPYTYQWSAGQNTTNTVFAQLSAGIYQFTISDRNGCSSTASYALVDPESIRVRFSDPKEVSCFGVCNNNRSDGAITVRASGGTSRSGRYSFTWSSGETTPLSDTSRAIALCQGKQYVTVVDDQNNCFIIDSTFRVPTRDSFSFNTLAITPPSCNGKKDGRASLNVLGGSTPYRYAWTGGLSSTNSIVNVGAGNYTLLVTDRNQCTFSIGLTVNQPDTLKLDTVRRLTNHVTCYGLTDGQIVVRRRGGNAGRTTYTWSTPQGLDSLATNLKAGAYAITATDINGCRDSMVYTILQPDSIFFFMQRPSQPRCNGQSTTIKVDTAYGSTGRYPFLVSLDNSVAYPVGYYMPTYAGTHQLTIIEQTTGCTLDTTITITEPPAVKVDFDSLPNNPGQVRLKVGLGDSLRLKPNVISSLPIDSVVWTPKAFLSFSGDPLRPWVKPYDDIMYKLTVYDVNGCEGFDEVTVELERNRNVFVPNIFSPNGDDKNDYFQPFTGLGVVRVNYMRVFDRWGELVYQTQNIPAGQDSNVGWDGTFRGRKMDSGVYVYIMEIVFEDGQILLYRGDVNLLRY